MILVDISLWAEHLRRGVPKLEQWLLEELVAVHPFVVGEIALGHLERRSEVLELLSALPSTAVSTHQEVLDFVDRQALAGTGIGWVDVHLLAAATHARMPIATLDRRLAAAARGLGLLKEG